MTTANCANKKIPSFLKLLRCAGPSGSRSVVSTSWFLIKIMTTANCANKSIIRDK